MPFKAVLVGDSGVGKTCIYKRLSKQAYDETSLPTIGGAFHVVKIQNSRGDAFELGLWDTAGQERFRMLMPMYFERAQILLFVYSITDHQSLEHLPEWYQLAFQRSEYDATVFVIGNKSDLEDSRAVSLGELNEMGNTIQAFTTIEVSAQTTSGIDGLIEEISSACNLIQEKQVDVSGDISPADNNEPQSNNCC
jgi:small GTP-binding protein